MEPITTGIAGAYLIKRASAGANRLFGPSFDEVAAAMARYTGNRLKNVGRVVENAERKSISSGTKDGSIPPRVAYRVLEESSYSDDEVIVEYLGGVLASSRTPRGRDDRGNTYTSLVARLSTYHLRTHFIFYSNFQKAASGQDLNIYDANALRTQLQLWIPLASYFQEMDFSADENRDSIWTSSVFALSREGLLDFDAGGNAEYLRIKYPNAPGAGIVITPTAVGIELFMWALGKGQGDVSKDFLTIENPEIEGLQVARDGMRVQDFPILD